MSRRRADDAEKKKERKKKKKHSTAQHCLAIFTCSSRLQVRDGTLYAIEELIHVLSRAGARRGEAILQIPAAMIQDIMAPCQCGEECLR
jgi:hypothetical protein